MADLRLSNYAVIKAAPGWNSSEAMVRLGAIHPANDIRTPGSNYSFTGDHSNAVGISRRVDGLYLLRGLGTVIYMR